MKNHLFGSLVLVAFSSIFSFSQISSMEGNKHSDFICNKDVMIGNVNQGSSNRLEKDDRIWLKVTNISKKTLKFSASHGDSTSNFLKGIGRDLDFYYDVVEKEKCDSQESGIKERPIGFTRVEIYYDVDLRPTDSFTFSVAKQYFTSGRAVFIKYECSRRCTRATKSIPQKVYFFTTQLPNNIENEQPGKSSHRNNW